MHRYEIWINQDKSNYNAGQLIVKRPLTSDEEIHTRVLFHFMENVTLDKIKMLHFGQKDD